MATVTSSSTSTFFGHVRHRSSSSKNATFPAATMEPISQRDALLGFGSLVEKDEESSSTASTASSSQRRASLDQDADTQSNDTSLDSNDGWSGFESSKSSKVRPGRLPTAPFSKAESSSQATEQPGQNSFSQVYNVRDRPSSPSTSRLDLHAHTHRTSASPVKSRTPRSYWPSQSAHTPDSQSKQSPGTSLIYNPADANPPQPMTVLHDTAHKRDMSLTSACPPATSSFTPSSRNSSHAVRNPRLLSAKQAGKVRRIDNAWSISTWTSGNTLDQEQDLSKTR